MSHVKVVAVGVLALILVSCSSGTKESKTAGGCQRKPGNVIRIEIHPPQALDSGAAKKEVVTIGSACTINQIMSVLSFRPSSKEAIQRWKFPPGPVMKVVTREGSYAAEIIITPTYKHFSLKGAKDRANTLYVVSPAFEEVITPYLKKVLPR